MAAAPLLQQMEQGLVSRIANGVSGFLATPSSGQTGQNVPGQAGSSSANSAQPPAPSPLSSGMNAALLSLQDDSGSSQGASPVHHRHHGAGGYRAASNMLSQLTDTTGQASSTEGAPSAVTA
jgi:hypothetical protein